MKQAVTDFMRPLVRPNAVDIDGEDIDPGQTPETEMLFSDGAVVCWSDGQAMCWST